MYKKYILNNASTIYSYLYRMNDKLFLILLFIINNNLKKNIYILYININKNKIILIKLKSGSSLYNLKLNLIFFLKKVLIKNNKKYFIFHYNEKSIINKLFIKIINKQYFNYTKIYKQYTLYILECVK